MPQYLDTLTSVSNLGSVLKRQRKYEEAEAMHRRSLKGREKVLGPEHPYTFISVSNLRSALLRQGKYEEAEELGVKAMETREDAWGGASRHAEQYKQPRFYAEVLKPQ